MIGAITCPECGKRRAPGSFIDGDSRCALCRTRPELHRNDNGCGNNRPHPGAIAPAGPLEDFTGGTDG